MAMTMFRRSVSCSESTADGSGRFLSLADQIRLIFGSCKKLGRRLDLAMDFYVSRTRPVRELCVILLIINNYPQLVETIKYKDDRDEVKLHYISGTRADSSIAYLIHFDAISNLRRSYYYPTEQTVGHRDIDLQSTKIVSFP